MNSSLLARTANEVDRFGPARSQAQPEPALRSFATRRFRRAERPIVMSPARAVARTLLAIVLALAFSTNPVPNAAGANDPATAGPTVRLMTVGDISLGWEVGRRIVRHGLDPFKYVEGYFDQADLVMGNLECVISTSKDRWPDKTIHLRAPLASADTLTTAGFDVLNVANNHALDFGVSGFEDTLARLDERQIGHVGGGTNYDAAHAPLIVEVNGLRIAFLGYVLPFWSLTHFRTGMWAAHADTPGLAMGKPAVVAADVAAARVQADIVIVTFHGGAEYHHRPTRQARMFAKAAIDAGATLVVGHHPHVLQGYRAAGGSLIAYSMGNFVFSRFTGRSNDSAILDVTLGADGVESFDWIPIVIVNGVPRPASGADARRIAGEIPSV
jgi:poly-gamma-glutamate capsule biosynthesis protein CapA/YwtB (metallophosphatase superfamily)